MVKHLLNLIVVRNVFQDLDISTLKKVVFSELQNSKELSVVRLIHVDSMTQGTTMRM